MPDDRDVYDRLAAHDPEVFGELFRQHRQALRGFLQQYTGAIETAEDLVQESFLHLWRRPEGFDPQRGSLKQYLFGIGRNLALQWQRSSRSLQHSPGEELATRETHSFMLRAMFQRLDQEHRAILWLREIEGYSYAELARILRIPEGTVKSRLFAARETLRKAWQGENMTRR
jgi:RNA polymerase sigma factor (sigma-70 family)